VGAVTEEQIREYTEDHDPEPPLDAFNIRSD
jgi:hypothetical protein